MSLVSAPCHSSHRRLQVDRVQHTADAVGVVPVGPIHPSCHKNRTIMLPSALMMHVMRSLQ